MAGVKLLILLWCTGMYRQDDDALLRRLETSEDVSHWQTLEAYRRHPLSLNNAAAAELTSLGLLTALQVSQLISYREQLGKLLSIYELQAIPGFDEATISMILPYVKVTDDSPPEKGVHTILLRTRPGYSMGRYRYHQTNRISTGILVKNNFYTAHLFLQRRRHLKALAIGDFTVNMGQGLINWQALATGKGGIVTHIKREGEILKPYSSAGADLFYRGAGITWQQGHLEGTGFIADGMMGGDLSLVYPQAHIGFNWVQQCMSIDYAATRRNYHLFGEIAMSGNHHTGMIMGVLATIGKVGDLAMFYRKYDTDYQPVHADAMGENSQPVNEEGLYTGICLHSIRHLQVDLYADVFHFPWLQYRTTAPSAGQEVLAALTYTPAKDTKLYARYLYTQKQQQAGDGFIPPLVAVIKRNYRFQLTTQLSKGYTWKSRVEVNAYGNQYGGLFQQELVCQLSSWPLRLTLAYTKFSTGGTDTRFYLLDRSVMYNYGLSQLYGSGALQSCTLRWKQGKNLTGWAKLDRVAGDHPKMGFTMQAMYII
jgi:hypothetical protein